jgi:hypothetical protein
VTFQNNVVRHTGAGINILGRDDIRQSAPARRIAIRNNLFADVGGPRWGGTGACLQILNGAAQVVVEHNTALQTGSILVAEGAPNEGFVFRANVLPHNEYGMIGTGTAPGTATIARFFPGAVIEGNVIAGGDPARYPRGNHFPASLAAWASAIRSGGLPPGRASRYRNGTRGGTRGSTWPRSPPAGAFRQGNTHALSAGRLSLPPMGRDMRTRPSGRDVLGLRRAARLRVSRVSRAGVGARRPGSATGARHRAAADRERDRRGARRGGPDRRAD